MTTSQPLYATRLLSLPRPLRLVAAERPVESSRPADKDEQVSPRRYSAAVRVLPTSAYSSCSFCIRFSSPVALLQNTRHEVSGNGRSQSE